MSYVASRLSTEAIARIKAAVAQVE
ncbi:hypothetical protein MPLA_90038 [Mesorhizobium sp. ORS 3359]|nr:hypothetical protein MPLA_90038 [Mesorhizobium sp. ORS 3359]